MENSILFIIKLIALLLKFFAFLRKLLPPYIPPPPPPDIEFIFQQYKKLYDLPTEPFEATVSGKLYDYVLRKDKFILLLLYDNNSNVFLTINVTNTLYWGLPGGSINNNETIQESINRHIKEEVCPHLENGVELLGDVEPVAWIENKFFCNGQQFHSHYGLAFIGRVRNVPGIKLDLGSFVYVNQDEMNYIIRLANQKVVKLFQDRFNEILRKIREFPDEEISTYIKYKDNYVIHNLFIKRFIYKNQKKFTNLIKSLIGNGVQSIIDVSCGDNSLIFNLGKELNIPIIVENDISWNQLEILMQKLSKESHNRNVIFTNHNVVAMPFRDNVFDVSYCRNTLHHMPNRESQRNLLDSMFRVSKKLILIEIEDPKETGGIPLRLHKYLFRCFLKDQGNMYLTQDTFKALVNEMFAGKAEISFETFSNIFMGKYLIATITKNKEA